MYDNFAAPSPCAPANRTPKVRGARRQPSYIALHRIGFQVEAVQLGQPRAAVGREHRIGLARESEHLLPLEHDVVLGSVQGHPGRGEALPHQLVAFQCRRLVVMVGEDGLESQPCRQPVLPSTG